MAAEVGDLNVIQDEDTLRRMWQQTEDFGRKKEIRMRMYRLREERLKSYYVTRETTTTSSTDNKTIIDRKPAVSSHAESLNDHGFLAMKTKEIRDSASPTMDLKQADSCHQSTRSVSGEKVTQSQQSTQSEKITSSSSRTSSTENRSSNQFATTSNSRHENYSIPHYDETALVSYDSQPARNASDHSHKLDKVYATSKYCSTSSSKREMISSADNQNNASNIEYSTNAVQHSSHSTNDQANLKTVDHSIHAGNDVLQNQITSRFSDTRNSERRTLPITTGGDIATTTTTTSTTVSIKSTADEQQTQSSGTVSHNQTRTETKTSAEDTRSGNVNRSIMNELRKLDSYLSTEAVNGSPVPSSPSSCVNETWNVEIANTREHESRPRHAVNEQSHSKISVDVSATHNAFASSLRASPERNVAPSGKHSSSKSSLERSSPEKSPRVSPEKCTSNDLSRRFTASFQNRITSTRGVSKSPSPTKQRRTNVSSTSEYDSDDSAATYSKKITSTSTISKVQKHASSSDRQHYNVLRQSKSPEYTSEGSVEREINRRKSPDSSPERSAFRPISGSSTNLRHSVVDRTQTTETRRQSFPQTPSSGQSPKKKPADERSTTEKILRVQQVSPEWQTAQNTCHAGNQLSSKNATSRVDEFGVTANPVPHVAGYPTSTHHDRKIATNIHASSIHRTDETAQTVCRVGQQNAANVTSRTNEHTLITKPLPNVLGYPSSTNHELTSTVTKQRNDDRIDRVDQTHKTSSKIDICEDKISSSVGRREKVGPKNSIENSTDRFDGKSRVASETVTRTVKSPPKATTSPERSSPKHSGPDSPTRFDSKSSFTTTTATNAVRSTPRGTVSPERSSPRHSSPGTPVRPDSKSSFTSDSATCTVKNTSRGTASPDRSSPRHVGHTVDEKISTRMPDVTGYPSSTTEQLDTPHPTNFDTPAERFEGKRFVSGVTKSPPTVKPERHSPSRSPPRSRQSAVKNQQFVDVTEEDAVEEVDTTAAIKSRSAPNQQQPIPVQTPKSLSPKKRSATINEFSGAKTRTASQPGDESTSESSSTSDSSDSEDEGLRGSGVTIEEITDEDSKDAPKSATLSRQTSKDAPRRAAALNRQISKDAPKSAALNTQVRKDTPKIAALNRQISTDAQIAEESKRLVDDFDLVEEEVVKKQTPTIGEDFATQERIVKEGEIDGCLPPIEDVLGKSEQKAVNDDFLKQERQYADKMKLAEISQPMAAVTRKPSTRDVTDRKDGVKRDRLQNRKASSTSSILKREKEVTRVDSNKEIKKTPAKKVAKESSPKGVVQEETTTKKSVTQLAFRQTESAKSPRIDSRTDVNSRIHTQTSDRSLKENNEKHIVRRLNAENKTRSETAIKPIKSNPVYQRRATDRIRLVHDLETKTKISNKENQTTIKSTSTKSLLEKPHRPTTAKRTANHEQTHRATTVVASPATKKPANVDRTPSSRGRTQTDSIRKTSADRTRAVDRTRTEHKTIRRTLTPKAALPDFKSTKKIDQTQVAVSRTAHSQSASTQKITSHVDATVPKIKTRHPIPTITTQAVPDSNRRQKKGRSLSVSSSSSSSLIDLDAVDTFDRSSVHDEQSEQKSVSKTGVQSREPHLNVIVRLPSSSRETTPNKQAEEPFCTVTDDEGVPRYADRVIEPEDVELINRRTLSGLRFEKITDLDEEEGGDGTVNVCVADRRNKFLQNAETAARVTTTTTAVEDDLFQNREQAVFRTKEIFETIAKKQAPPVTRPPPILNRPSIFEQRRLRETIEEETDGHDGEHKTVSKKLTQQDYQEYARHKENVVGTTDRNEHKTVSRKLTEQDYQDYLREKADNVQTSSQSTFVNGHATDLCDGMRSKRTEIEDVEVEVRKSEKTVETGASGSSSTKDTLSRRTSSPSKDVCKPSSQPAASNKETKHSHQSVRSEVRGPSPTKEARPSSPSKETKQLQQLFAVKSEIRCASPTKDVRRVSSPTKDARPSSPSKEMKQLRELFAVHADVRCTSTGEDVKRPSSPIKETKHTRTASSVSSPKTQPDFKCSPEKPTRTSSPPKDVARPRPTKSDSFKEFKPIDAIKMTPSRGGSPTKDVKRPKSPSPDKTKSRISPFKSSAYESRESSSVKLTSKTRQPSPPKEDSRNSIRKTIQRYETHDTTKRTSLNPKPIEITTVEVKPNRRVFEHTAVTNVNTHKRNPVEETFNRKLSRVADECKFTVTVDSSTKRKPETSPSPDRSAPRVSKSPSPSKEPKPKSSRPKSPSSTDRRQKSPSPPKNTAKLKQKLQTTDADTKKKHFEKRISTTGGDYHNRKKFFETKSQQELLKAAVKTDTKCEINERVRVTSSADTSRRQEERKSPERRTERMETRKISQERGNVETRKSPEKIVKKTPFGVTLRKTAPTTNTTTSVRQKVVIEISEDKIEEIFDLELLEKMLEKEVKYDVRSRIRAQIRLVKRQQETKKTSRTPSPEKIIVRDARKTSSNQTNRVVTSIEDSTGDRRDKVKKRLFDEDVSRTRNESKTFNSSSSSRLEKSSRTDSGVKLSATENCPETTTVQTTYQTDFGGSSTGETKSITESIISSYGVGPTDENGRPLFGLKALRTSGDVKFVDDGDLDASRKRNEYSRDVTDHSGKPLFGLKALQRSGHNERQNELDGGALSHFNTSTQKQVNTSGDKFNGYRTSSTSESSSTVYTSRTAMKSDNAGNVSILQEEVKGELHSKDGNEPTGKMTATRYSYQRPEGGEATVKTKTATHLLNARDGDGAYTTRHHNAIDAKPSRADNSSATVISDNDSWKSKFGSSSLIRKISNEHFEKAHRKFSSDDVSADDNNGNDRRASFHSKTTESSSETRKSYSKTSSSDRFEGGYSAHRKESVDEPARSACELRASPVSGYETGSSRPVGRGDSFKDIKSKFQQATVSSSMKQVSKSASDDRESPFKYKSERRSTEEFSTSPSSFSNHESKTSHSYMVTSSESSQSFSHNNGGRSEHTDDEKEAVTLLNRFVGGSISLSDLERIQKPASNESLLSTKAASLVRQVEKQQNKTKQSKEEVDIERISDEDQLRNLLEACTDYESRRLIRARLRGIMAENKTNADILPSADGVVRTQTNGECISATAQRSQSSPSSIIEDSGTESGEDLRLLNPELLAEVRGALTKLESALPTLDTARRASIIPLVTKLQSCLKVSENQVLPSSHSTLPSKRFTNKQLQRKTRHTVGVSKEELADARKWLAENFLDDNDDDGKLEPKQNSTSSIPLKYDATKVYKPVKFTPMPPKEDREKSHTCKHPLVRGSYEKPAPLKLVTNDSPKSLFAFRTYTDAHQQENKKYQKQFSEEQLKKENCSSDEGDVSSTEEEPIKADLSTNNGNGGSAGKAYTTNDNGRKVPSRFQKNNKKIRMKRANTIDIPKLLNCETITSSGDESVYKSADEVSRRNGFRMDVTTRSAQPPRLEVKTEKDLKFAKLLEQTKQEDLQTKTVTYNPNAAGGAQWSNRFSNIKTTFEQGSQSSKSPSSPDEMSKLFKPIRKVATFPKESSPAANNFSHAFKSPFKPVTKLASFYETPSADGGYDGKFRTPEKRHTFNSLERGSSARTPKTYYAPKEANMKPTSQKEYDYYNCINRECNLNRKPVLYYINPNPNYVCPKPTYYVEKPTPVRYNYTNYKPDYFPNEPSAYLHLPEYPNYNSQPVSPTIPTTSSSSPTYQDYNPYLSLPTSPLPARPEPPQAYWKPMEYCEERPAHSKIMGQPQQAVVVNNQPTYRNPATKSNVVREFIATKPRKNVTPESRNYSTYQKLAEQSPVLQNFAQNVPRTPAIKHEATKPKPALQKQHTLSKIDNEPRTPPMPRKQVKIVEDEENLPEQFFVQNQRNKFESMSANSGAQQPLPPQINEKAFSKPVSNLKKHDSTPVIVQQNRSPPQSPVQMPSVLQKSESWHQMIMERMKQARPPSPIKPKIPRAKSTHNLATAPKQYEATLSPESISIKQQTVEQFLMKDKQRQISKSPMKAPSSPKLSARIPKLNEDFKQVDEAFEILFREASGKIV